jgi:NAD(P)-dependent dehydrogenase (short-subunit alcohol dehydrogenase family)
VTPAGEAWFCRIGLDTSALKRGRNGVARQCLDWTERRHHLAGPLGVQFMSLLCAKGWLGRVKASRAVTVTPAGWTGLKTELGVEISAITASPNARFIAGTEIVVDGGMTARCD